MTHNPSNSEVRTTRRLAQALKYTSSFWTILLLLNKVPSFFLNSTNRGKQGAQQHRLPPPSTTPVSDMPWSARFCPGRLFYAILHLNVSAYQPIFVAFFRRSTNYLHGSVPDYSPEANATDGESVPHSVQPEPEKTLANFPFFAAKSAYPPVESDVHKNRPIGVNKVPNSTASLPRAQRRAQILRSSAGSAPAERFIPLYTWTYRRISRYLLHFFTDLQISCTGLIRITHPSITPLTANPYLAPFGRNRKKRL